ncbi:MAG: hypothetical protein IJ043_04920 [Clostridia bacterium]|nr:hypothetical protein [Clostridia bacterium]
MQKLPSGRVLLILNDDTARTHITVLLSEDDGTAPSPELIKFLDIFR